MTRYALLRLWLVVPTLAGVLLFVFALLEIVPGDPAAVFLGENATPEAVASLREALGLDRPLPVRLFDYAREVLRGNLGQSIFQREPVLDIVLRRLPATVELALAAFLLAVLSGVALGTMAALWRGTFVDVAASALAQLGVSMPVFWLGILLMAWLSVDWGWLPAFGRGEPLPSALASGDIRLVTDALRHLILPTITLAIHHAAVISRLVRASMLSTLHEEYVIAARARGLSALRVTAAHALTNAILPVLSVAGVRFGALLGGAVLTESIFGWPGLGQLAVTAISERDLPLVQGVVLVFALMFILVNLVVDLAHASLDPRIRLETLRAHA